MPKKIRIIDLDNCISDDQWRLARINWKEDDMHMRYYNYHKQGRFDNFKNRDLVETSDRIAIFTARPKCFKEMTKGWLLMNRINHSHLLMRPDGCHRNSVDLKRDMLKHLLQHIEPGAEISCAYDDRQDIVDMYLENFIPAEVRKIHDCCAMTKPKHLEES